MKTEDLIEALVQDAPRPQLSPARRILVAIALGAIVAGVLFALSLGVRPDLGSALETWRFVLKPVLAVICLVSAWWACLQLTRPEVRPQDVAGWLLVTPALLGVAVLYELVAIPPALWSARLVGSYARICLLAIPLLSIVPLAVLLIALRVGAPRSPISAGAVAGLLAGALSATLYATHCPDDSPLFVAVWYTLAVGLVTATGALVGRRILRW
jgi:hypothetical protein